MRWPLATVNCLTTPYSIEVQVASGFYRGSIVPPCDDFSEYSDTTIMKLRNQFVVLEARRELVKVGDQVLQICRILLDAGGGQRQVL